MTRPQTCKSFCYNLPPVGKNELAKSALRASTNSNGIPTFISTLAISRAFIPAFVPAQSPLGGIHTNLNLQQATKLALKLFVQGQAYA